MALGGVMRFLLLVVLLTFSVSCTRKVDLQAIKIDLGSQLAQKLDSFPADKKVCFAVTVNADDLPKNVLDFNSSGFNNQCVKEVPGINFGYIDPNTFGNKIEIVVPRGPRRDIELIAYVTETTDFCPGFNDFSLDTSKIYKVASATGIDLVDPQQSIELDPIFVPGGSFYDKELSPHGCNSVPSGGAPPTSGSQFMLMSHSGNALAEGYTDVPNVHVNFYESANLAKKFCLSESQTTTPPNLSTCSGSSWKDIGDIFSHQHALVSPSIGSDHTVYLWLADDLGNIYQMAGLESYSITYDNRIANVQLVTPPSLIDSSNAGSFSLAGTCVDVGTNIELEVYADPGYQFIASESITCSSSTWTSSALDLSSIPDGNNVYIQIDHEGVNGSLSYLDYTKAVTQSVFAFAFSGAVPTGTYNGNPVYSNLTGLQVDVANLPGGTTHWCLGTSSSDTYSTCTNNITGGGSWQSQTTAINGFSSIVLSGSGELTYYLLAYDGGAHHLADQPVTLIYDNTAPILSGFTIEFSPKSLEQAPDFSFTGSDDLDIDKIGLKIYEQGNTSNVLFDDPNYYWGAGFHSVTALFLNGTMSPSTNYVIELTAVDFGGNSIVSSHVYTSWDGVAPSSIVDIAAGDQYTCVVYGNSGRSIKCFGAGIAGRRGVGDTIGVSDLFGADVLESNGPLIDSLSSQYGHTCSVGKYGNVSCFGENSFGQLGNGSTVNIGDSPGDSFYIPTASRIKQVSAGYDHTCAINANNRVLCWGDDSKEQLGNGAGVNSTIDASSATEIGSHHFRLVRAGFKQTCAIGTDGLLYCWGDNTGGSLGITAGSTVNSPQLLTNMSGAYFKDVAMGKAHICGLTADGKVLCWGSASSGQLGRGDFTDRKGDISGLASITNPYRFKQVVSSEDSTCALELTGDVKCWGRNDLGQLGLGNTSNQNIPNMVPLDYKVRKLAAGLNHFCALYDNGNFSCWGDGQYGQLAQGDNSNIGDDEIVRSKPILGIESNPVGEVIEIEGSLQASCMLISTGEVRCWGGGPSGLLGSHHTNFNNSTTGLHDITPVDLGFRAIDISVGESTACALSGDGSVRCWGNTGLGALGDGSTNSVVGDASPVKDGLLVSGGATQYISLSSGDEFHCGLMADGSVRCWGDNSSNQLGNGISGGNYSSPQTVSSLANVVEIDSGGLNTCAVQASGVAACWGDNSRGQLGINSTTAQNTYANVTGGHNFQSVRVGYTYACGIKDNGSLTCWGEQVNGVLGNTLTTGYSATPVTETAISEGIRDIVTGKQSVCLQSLDGNLNCWGDNTHGLVLNTGLSYSDATSLNVGSPADFVFSQVFNMKGNSFCAYDLYNGGFSCWGYGGTENLNLLGSGSNYGTNSGDRYGDLPRFQFW